MMRKNVLGIFQYNVLYNSYNTLFYIHFHLPISRELSWKKLGS
jgi:hypothetical protein